MKKVFFLCLVLCTAAVYAQPVYVCNNGEVTFYSKTPLEDIDAVSNSLNSIYNTSSNEIVFVVQMTSFKFKKAMMQDHFNEKYVESDKYPKASYKGKINETVDVTKDGTYDVTTTGTLTIHGVDKPRTEKGKLTVKDGVISIQSEFKVALKEFNIEIPKLVMQNIAEVVDVNFSATYEPYKKESK